MRDIRLLALDLDGTLLNSAKELTGRSRTALQKAADNGIQIVPATGRFYRGMPEAIRELPFVRYVITINGACVYDVTTDTELYSAPIPLRRAVEVLERLDELPVIYDCYQNGWGWMTRSMMDNAPQYIDHAPTLDMVYRLRTPVPELKTFLKERGEPVQKIQLFTRDREYREHLLQSLRRQCPDLQITAALPNNIEINSSDANKGAALAGLLHHLAMPAEKSMAFGDGLNDLTMIQMAGVGVAVKNSAPQLIRAADVLAESCDADGAAKIIEKLLSQEGKWNDI